MLRRLKAWPLILLGIVVFQLFYSSQQEEGGDVPAPTITTEPADEDSPFQNPNDDASAQRYAPKTKPVLFASLIKSALLSYCRHLSGNAHVMWVRPTVLCRQTGRKLKTCSLQLFTVS